MGIEKKLKMLVGRQLSEKKMKNAIHVSSSSMQNPDYFCAGFPDSQSNRNYTLVMKIDNTLGYLELSKTFGRSGFGSNNVWKDEIRKFYNPKGELEKRKVITNSDWAYGKLIPGTEEITVYDPAGSFTGKKTVIR